MNADVVGGSCIRSLLAARGEDIGTRGVSDPRGRRRGHDLGPGWGSLTPLSLPLLCARALGGGIERRRDWSEAFAATCTRSEPSRRVDMACVVSPPVLAALRVNQSRG